MENELNWLLLGFVDCLLKEVDGGGALFFGGGEFLHEVDEGGEGGCLVAEGGMFILVVELGGHLGDEGREECADSGIVLLEEFLAGEGFGFYGADGGICGLIDVVDDGGGLGVAVGVGVNVVKVLAFILFEPTQERGAGYLMLAGNS